MKSTIIVRIRQSGDRRKAEYKLNYSPYWRHMTVREAEEAIKTGYHDIGGYTGVCCVSPSVRA